MSTDTLEHEWEYVSGTVIDTDPPLYSMMCVRCGAEAARHDDDPKGLCSTPPRVRVRISHVVVQPVLVYDDGDELSPGPATQAFPVPLHNLGGLADRLRAEVAAMNAATDPTPE